jgi:hypothetical protein
MRQKMYKKKLAAQKLVGLALVVLGVIGAFQSCGPGMLYTTSENSAPQPLIGHETKVEIASTQARLADHNLVASTLSSIFGQTADVTAVIAAEILAHSSIFGGRCDSYRGDCAGDINGPYVPSLAANSVLREAHKIRACDQILELASGAGLKTAMGQIAGATLAQSPTDATLAEAYVLFYPGQTISETSINALKSVLPLSTSAPIQWKLVLTVLCHDPNWELP